MKHHWFPQSLLENWCGPQDGKLTAYSKPKPDGSVHCRRCSPSEVCQQHDLYSFAGMPEEAKHSVEVVFMQRIDSDAAKLVDEVAKNGLKGISGPDRERLAVFLLSLLVRTPEPIARARQVGKEAHTRAMTGTGETISAAGKMFAQLIQRHRPDFVSDFALATLPEVLTKEEPVVRLTSAAWATFHFPAAGPDLLLSDRPCILQGSIFGTFHLAVPLGPRHVIAVSTNEGMLHAMAKDKPANLVNTINIASTKKSVKYVYGTGDQYRGLVQTHLRLSKAQR